MAQNLIPNPGFENHKGSAVADWEQPDGHFYHFTFGGEESGLSHNGDCYNALCMYNDKPSEFLQTKLKTPLIKGQWYKAKMAVKLSGFVDKKTIYQDVHYELMKQLHWTFSVDPADVAYKLMLYKDPDVRFFTITDKKAYQWHVLEATYQATGNEEYLQVGYLLDIAAKTMEDEKAKAILEEVRELEKEMNEEIEQLREESRTANGGNTATGNFDIYDKGKKKKNKKKEEKEMAAFKANLHKNANELNDKIAKVEARYQKEIDVLTAPLEKDKDKSFRVNYYFDDFVLEPIEEKELSILNRKIEVGETINLDFIYFETAKSDLLPASNNQLNDLIALLKKYPNMRININGYTDNQGTDTSNKVLSEDRAGAVLTHLTKNGVEITRLKSNGFGSANPIGSNATEKGRQQNRRVEFVIVQK
jgi:outer membrane protein OmpA-like peptidoglycan-associated protein